MRKNKKDNDESLSGPGWSAYQEVPEDFDFETWKMNMEHRVHRNPLSKIIWKLMSYPFIILKKLLYKPTIVGEFKEYEESPEEIRFHKLMFEIWDTHKIEFEKFANQVVDSGEAKIELRTRRVVYQKMKLQGNWGVGEFVEKLDGSDRHHSGWFINSGSRNEKIEKVEFQLAVTAASLETTEYE
jgi:hypothetical protein